MTTTPRTERGSALLISIMVTMILALLGLGYLTLADQENSIAVNQRDTDQLLWVAEGGAKMVKAWFDRPVEGDPNNPLWKFMGDYDLRRTLYWDRTQRLFDHDNDPNTVEVLADGTTGKPYFRDGMQAGADPNHLTFFNKPYRGSAVAEYRGLETGPDMVLESNNTAPDFLDVINSRVVGDRARQEQVGRIQKIEIYGPPVMDINGVLTRYGIATVKVTAVKFRRMGNVGIIPVTTTTSQEVARRQVKMVLNEVPYPGPSGPFTTCTTLDIQNSNVTIHWGEVAALTTATIHPASSFLSNTMRSVPWGSPTRYLDPNLLTGWVTANDGQTDSDFDPWFKLRSGGGIDPAALVAEGAPFPTAVQPWPYVPTTTVANDTTGLFQFAPPQCPNFDYQIWKNVALSGGKNIHYMVYAGSADSYRKDGKGAADTVRNWTHGEEGFWFFDTTDRLPPDPNGTNIAPAIGMSGTWASSGFIYLNSDWDSAGTGGGSSRVIIPPGEPWNDANGDGIADPGEFVNLGYPTSLSDDFTVYAPGNALAGQTASVTSTNGVVYSYTTDPNARDDQGIPFSDTINFQGVVYIEGEFQMTGSMSIFGALVTNGGMVTGLPTAGTPDIYFDERLIKGEWPPPELNLPRTTITFWQTDM